MEKPSSDSIIQQDQHPDSNSQMESDIPFSRYTDIILNSKLPSTITRDVFSFRNPDIVFQGRKNEIECLKKWIKQPNLSLWAITGQGGYGKSRFALHFVQKELEKENVKIVWLDGIMIEDLQKCYNYNSNFSVLFICDYAAQFEAQLSVIIEKMSRTNVNAKFLLLERSYGWYYRFISRNASVHEQSYMDDPIELSASRLIDEEWEQIMHCLSQHYNQDEIPKDIQKHIIDKAAEMSFSDENVYYYSAIC